MLYCRYYYCTTTPCEKVESSHPFPVDRELEHHIPLMKALGGIESLPATTAGMKVRVKSQTLVCLSRWALPTGKPINK